MANRRSLYGQIVSEYLLSGRPFSDLFDEFVDAAGECPCGGAFSWEDKGNTGVIHCDYHDGSGGSESGPVLHGTANMTQETFLRGAVIQDETGTCVILSGMWSTWTAYSGGTKAAALAAQVALKIKFLPSLIPLGRCP